MEGHLIIDGQSKNGVMYIENGASARSENSRQWVHRNTESMNMNIARTDKCVAFGKTDNFFGPPSRWDMPTIEERSLQYSDPAWVSIRTR